MVRNVMRLRTSININFPLIIGTAIIILLLLASMYPEYLSQADPYGVQRLSYESDGSSSKVIVPPIPPSKDYPFGTDERGRDMISLIVYGTKNTILAANLVALFRLCIAGPLAFLAAYKNRMADWLIKQFKILFSALPILIAVVFLSRIALFRDVIQNSLVSSTMWLILLGWSPLANQLKQAVSEVLQQDFIEGEIAIGKSKWEIALQNIIPHIIPKLVVLYFLEVAIVLLTMAQLGVLGISFSGGYYREGSLAVPDEFDWASLLQFAYLLFGSSKMWLVIFPAATFAISVIGFNLFGEGLRLEFEKRDSRVISYLKKLPGFFAPQNFLYEIKNFRGFKPIVITKAIVYILILTILFFPVLPSRYKLDADAAMTTISELTKDKYQGRRAGSPGMKQASAYMAGKLKECGIQPLDGKYIHEFNMTEAFNIKYSELKVLTSEGNSIEFEHRNDYYVYSVLNQKNRLQLKVIQPLSFGVNLVTLSEDFWNKALIFDTRGLDQKLVTSTLSVLSHVGPPCLILIQNWKSADDYLKLNRIEKSLDRTIVMSFSSDMGDELLKYNGSTIEYAVEVDEYYNTRSYNVLGFIPGSNPQYQDECIIIGCSLDSIGDDKEKRYPGALSAGAAALELEIARTLAANKIQPEITIVFGFWDGTFTDYRGSKAFVSEYTNKKFKKTYYIDLAYFTSKSSNKLLLDTSKSIPKSKQSQTYIKALKGVARSKDVPIQYSRLYNPVLEDFMGIGKEVLTFGSNEIDGILSTPGDTYDNIDRAKLLRYGQVVLDSIIKIADSTY